jgi:hypothetical protein
LIHREESYFDQFIRIYQHHELNELSDVFPGQTPVICRPGRRCGPTPSVPVRSTSVIPTRRTFLNVSTARDSGHRRHVHK